MKRKFAPLSLHLFVIVAREAEERKNAENDEYKRMSDLIVILLRTDMSNVHTRLSYIVYLPYLTLSLLDSNTTSSGRTPKTRVATSLCAPVKRFPGMSLEMISFTAINFLVVVLIPVMIRQTFRDRVAETNESGHGAEVHNGIERRRPVPDPVEIFSVQAEVDAGRDGSIPEDDYLGLGTQSVDRLKLFSAKQQQQQRSISFEFLFCAQVVACMMSPDPLNSTWDVIYLWYDNILQNTMFGIIAHDPKNFLLRLYQAIDHELGFYQEFQHFVSLTALTSIAYIVLEECQTQIERIMIVTYNRRWKKFIGMIPNHHADLALCRPKLITKQENIWQGTFELLWNVDGQAKLCMQFSLHQDLVHTRPLLTRLTEKNLRNLDMFTTDEFGLTHFHVACSYGYRDVVQKFLDRGQDPNLLVRETGDSPLLLALKWRHKEVAEMLLRRGADPNLPNKNGLAPLHVICQTSVDGDLAKFFFKIIDELNQRLQVNVQDKFGDTPLNFAVRNDEEVMLKLLLSRGADPTLVNAAGWTTLDIMFQSLQVKQLRFRQAVLRYQRVQLAGAVQLGEQLWSDTDGVSRIASDNGYGQSSDKKYSAELYVLCMAQAQERLRSIYMYIYLARCWDNDFGFDQTRLSSPTERLNESLQSCAHLDSCGTVVEQLRSTLLLLLDASTLVRYCVYAYTEKGARHFLPYITQVHERDSRKGRREFEFRPSLA
ncbi:unnamed protein product [Trichogramma brassicae]|uniref:Uncharacterized protein n=1 Tax=Trichogramma brassicae TaxID=86971 RepID=A0A6H5IJU0_9HYME|nr:unnamed protein product [Trichogramma brassicae]